MTWLRSIGSGLLGVSVGVYLFNASWLAAEPNNARSFIAHRGVHQTHPHEGVDDDTCTAEIIHTPRHGLIENTLPSIRAAFEAGADVVEIDIHPTTDGEFAVFHDWTLDCRTEATGVTRAQTMAFIRTLDAGYGYTADGGETYPLRGTGVGMIPTLSEVLGAFPERRFLINFKGGRTAEADLLSAYLMARNADLSRILIYGAERPVARFSELHPHVRRGGRRSMRDCLTGYAAMGWFGGVPKVCENSIVFVPRNYTRWMWGWPNRFQARMTAANAEVWIIGDWDGARSFTTGLDDAALIDTLPDSFRGGVWTNRIEIVGSAAIAESG